jgi:hypothetical protein
MNEVVTELGIFDSTLKAFGLIRDGKLHRSGKVNQALFALYTALNETVQYVEKQSKWQRRDINKEHELALLWDKASIPVRYIDGDLAKKCFIRASYWLEPDTFSQSQIKSQGITLKAMREETFNLLVERMVVRLR